MTRRPQLIVLLQAVRRRYILRAPFAALNQRRLYYRIGLVTQRHASLDMLLRVVWAYCLPEDKRYRMERPQSTIGLVRDVRRWFEQAELPADVTDAAFTVLTRLDTTVELRNRVVHDYWQPRTSLDPAVPGGREPAKQERWMRFDMRAPFGTVRAGPAGLAYVDRCLDGLQARQDDVQDLLLLFWHHTDIITGGRPTDSSTDVLDRIARRTA